MMGCGAQEFDVHLGSLYQPQHKGKSRTHGSVTNWLLQGWQVSIGTSGANAPVSHLMGLRSSVGTPSRSQEGSDAPTSLKPDVGSPESLDILQLKHCFQSLCSKNVTVVFPLST